MIERFYAARLVKAGPRVGVRLVWGGPIVDGEEQDRSPRWQVVIGHDRDGVAVDQIADSGAPMDAGGRTLRDVQPIDEGEYRYFVAHGQWAEAHAPNHPRANPTRAIDLASMPSLF